MAGIAIYAVLTSVFGAVGCIDGFVIGCCVAICVGRHPRTQAGMLAIFAPALLLVLYLVAFAAVMGPPALPGGVSTSLGRVGYAFLRAGILLFELIPTIILLTRRTEKVTG